MGVIETQNAPLGVVRDVAAHARNAIEQLGGALAGQIVAVVIDRPAEEHEGDLALDDPRNAAAEYFGPYEPTPETVETLKRNFGTKFDISKLATRARGQGHAVVMLSDSRARQWTDFIVATVPL
jgi:hypothetical protein